MSTLVVGGGWAGLSTAVELTRRGERVVLLEAARQLGGRARRVPFDDLRVDNGQHILLGAYRSTLDLLEVLGVRESQAFKRLPLNLTIARPNRLMVQVQAAPLPAPFNLAWGLIRSKGFTALERRRALSLCLHMVHARFQIQEDLDVGHWLVRHRQPIGVIRTLWEPLCVAALNTPLARASTRVFLRVMHDAFARRRGDSDLLLPRKDLSAVVPDPAASFIEQRGGSVRLSTRAISLLVEEGRVRGVRTREAEIRAEQVVLAVPPTPARRLIRPLPALGPVAERMAALAHEPICTIYLRYPSQTCLGVPMLGLAGATAQWVVDRAVTGQPGLMAVVISASGPHMNLDNEALAQQVAGELGALFPRWAAPQSWRVLREKHATFSCRPGAHALRPGNATAVAGLWLAGDHTATGYPATLEGAVRSGLQCAGQLLESIRA